MKHVRIFWIALFSFGIASSLEAATATWDRNPESNITGYRLSYGTQPGIHPTSIDVGNVVSYQFFPPQGFRYYVVVQAVNSSGVIGPKSQEAILDLTTTTQNQPPTLQQPANQSSVRNTTVSLALIASDPQGTPVSYSASSLPPGLAINSTTGLISGTVTTVGTYTVTATASDGSLTASRTFTWTVTSSTTTTTTVDLSPIDTSIDVFGANYINRSKLYAYTYPANRVGQAILMKFDLSQIPAGAVIQSATLQLSLVEMDNNTADPNYSVSLHQVINRNPDLARATGVTANGVVNWTANSCCENNAPMAQADISPARAVTTVNRTAGLKAWNALQLVQAWRSAPASNYGLLLNADTTKGTDRYRVFASMQHETASARPSLRIVYAAASASTATTASTATAASTVSASARTANVDSVSTSSVTAAAESQAVGAPALVDSGETPIAGDFDGDGVADPATFHSATGEWRVKLSTRNFNAVAPVVWGGAGDVPVPADYDGDRRTDIAVYRPSTGTWHVVLSSTGQQSSLDVQWGDAADRPLPLDFDRDGRADLALPRSGGFEILLSGSNYTRSVTVR